MFKIISIVNQPVVDAEGFMTDAERYHRDKDYVRAAQNYVAAAHFYWKSNCPVLSAKAITHAGKEYRIVADFEYTHGRRDQVLPHLQRSTLFFMKAILLYSQNSREKEMTECLFFVAQNYAFAGGFAKSMGWDDLARRNYDEAAKNYRIASQTLGEFTEEVAQGFKSAAECYLLAGDLASAGDCFMKAAESYFRVGKPAEAVSHVSDAFEYYARAGKIESAVELFANVMGECSEDVLKALIFKTYNADSRLGQFLF